MPPQYSESSLLSWQAARSEWSESSMGDDNKESPEVHLVHGRLPAFEIVPPRSLQFRRHPNRSERTRR
jgi:hypothetical protein